MRPEDYWIGLGENVIGLDVLKDDIYARQYETYKAIAVLVVEKRAQTVLDIGCNYGVLKQYLYVANYLGAYVGLDSNPAAIELAQRLYSSEAFHVENIRKLKTASSFWDCVIVKDVIEHLESIEPLREAFRVSSKYVIIATYLPWHDAPSVIQQHPDGYYTNTYNRTEVIALARECGFELEETVRTQETNGTPNEITVWRRIDCEDH